MSIGEQTRVDQWSRPRLQRQELGPVLHDIGHTIYDAAEDMLLADDNEYGFTLTAPHNLNQLATFGETLAGAVNICTTDILKTVPSHLMDEFIGNQKQLVVINDTGMRGFRELVFSYDFRGALDEGLDSGVVSPLQLYRTVKLFEDRRILELPGEPNFTIEFEPTDVLQRIASTEFQTMLHQLATGTNGSLGTASNRAREIRDENRTTFALISKYGWGKSFMTDETGTVVGFTPDFLAHVRHNKTTDRVTWSARSDSGGCPVRHATYKKLGDTAQEYFDVLGTPDARPRAEGESLITRASRFVTTTLLKSIERSES